MLQTLGCCESLRYVDANICLTCTSEREYARSTVGDPRDSVGEIERLMSPLHLKDSAHKPPHCGTGKVSFWDRKKIEKILLDLPGS